MVVIEEQGTFLFDEKVKISDEMRQLKTYKTALIGRNGETIGTVGLARDVTDIWNTHAEFTALINHLPFPMMILNDKYEFVSANSKFDNIFETIDDFAKFDINDFGQKYFGQNISMQDKKDHIMQTRMASDRGVLSFSIEKSAIYDVFNELTGYFYIFDDITMQKEYEQKLRLISQTDELTGISNRIGIRKYFDANYKVAIENKIPVTVMMLDVDFFKNYNDTYGHVSGDNVLSIVGEILNSLTLDKNIFVARYGGEEFLLVALGKTFDESNKIALKIKAELSNRSIKHKSSPVLDIITASIGVAYYTNINDSISVSALVKTADDMLYEAKNTGRNKISSKVIDI